MGNEIFILQNDGTLIVNLLEQKSALVKVGTFLSRQVRNRISQWGIREGEMENDEGSMTKVESPWAIEPPDEADTQESHPFKLQ